MADEALELTILMPCLNEAETLQRCIVKALGYLQRSGVSGEVLISDNGSTDGSQAIAEAAGARVTHAPVRGYGGALAHGIAAARGRFVIMGDADDSYDFSQLDGFIAALRAGADIAIGNRFRGGIAPGAMPPLHRYLGNPVLSFIGRLFFRVPAGDFHCGLRGFRRDRILALDLRTTGMEFASEMLVVAALNRLRIDEVPTTLSKDGRSRPPHLRTWRDGWRHLKFLLIYSPRWLFLYPGLAVVAAGAILSTLLLLGPVTLFPGLTLDVHTLLLSALAIPVGLQLILFGVLARRIAQHGGLIPASVRFEKALAGLTSDRLLIIGALAFAVGAAGVSFAILDWSRKGFGALDYQTTMRLLIPSAAALIAGVQMAASGFLVGLVGMVHPAEGKGMK